MVNYQNAKIYRLVCDDPNLVYYGATTKALCDRLSNHKSNCRCRAKQLFDVGGVKIFLVEKFPCDSKEELNARERYYIENNECVNRNIPGRTKKEYNKQYREENKEHIKEHNKQYNEANKDKKQQYYQDNRERFLANANQRYLNKKASNV
jgi:hypothetical protein